MVGAEGLGDGNSSSKMDQGITRKTLKKQHTRPLDRASVLRMPRERAYLLVFPLPIPPLELFGNETHFEHLLELERRITEQL